MNRGESTIRFPSGRITRYEWAPNEDRALCPNAYTPGVSSYGNAGLGGRRASLVPMDWVGQATAARHIAAASSGFSG